MHTVQRALAVRASVKCGGRRTLAGGMIKSAHGGRAETTVSMRPCSDSCCVREAASRGGYSRALPLTVCAFERRRKRVLRGRSGAKNGRTPVYLRISSCSTTVRSNLISWRSASLDFTPGY